MKVKKTLLDLKLLVSNIAYMIRFVDESEENIIRKGQTAGYQQSYLFPKCLQMPSPSGWFIIVIVW